MSIVYAISVVAICCLVYAIKEQMKTHAPVLSFDKERANKIRRRFEKYIKIGRKTFWSPKPSKLLENPDARKAMIAFASKYEQDIWDELRDGRLDWNNENCQMFFKMMATKFRASERDLIWMLFYTLDELAYRDYRDSLSSRSFGNHGDVVLQTVVYDIYNEVPTGTEEERVRRFCYEKRIKLGFFSSLWLLKKYSSIREKMKMDQFEKDLITKNERQKESIDERIRFATKVEFFRLASEGKLETEPSNYIIEGSDHSRQSRLDARYRNHIGYVMVTSFESKCAKCREVFTGQLELDHFWLPKSQGGNFAMRSKNGFYVNNCIPLCKPCNASKGARSFLDFFSLEELRHIIPMSQSLNQFINTHLADFEDESFGEVRKKAA